MKALDKHRKKVFMWHKVKELFSKGFNKTQIGIELEIHRKTVSKYLSMSEESFYKWLEHSKNQPKKLEQYHGFVHKLLASHPYLSASQVEDRLKEEFNDLPVVNSKTVYNFTESIREKYGIKKQVEKLPRQYEKILESEYGIYAQADFGEYYMQTQGPSRKKIYFFTMVLCRSRHKYLYCQSKPFTTMTTIKAHEQAFKYFEGQPRKIIYDQDKVMLVKENLGDLLLTREFQNYCKQMDFETIFCRKSDPESKGKIESVVKFVKYNFLRGRTFIGEEELNHAAQGWLSRTGNGKEHAGIKKVPMQEWQIEKDYLQPLKPSPELQQPSPFNKYKVRKDNTILYKSNYYTLPTGTYKNEDTCINMKVEQSEVFLYDINNSLITVHPLSHERGKTINNNDHKRDKSQSINKLKETILQLMPDEEKGSLYIDLVAKDKPRYIRDNLLALKKHIPEYDPGIIIQALNFCLENHVYNANKFVDVSKYYLKEQDQKIKAKAIIPQVQMKKENLILNIELTYSKLSTYETIL
jgi:predicted transcriptional regulator